MGAAGTSCEGCEERHLGVRAPAIACAFSTPRRLDAAVTTSMYAVTDSEEGGVRRRHYKTGSVGALEEVVHARDQRFEVGVIDQRARHADGVAEEEALVQSLATAEGAAGDIPGQSVERHAIAGE